MAYLNQMTNNTHIVNSFGAPSGDASLLSMVQRDFSPLLFDSGMFSISGENRRRIRFNPKSVTAKVGTLGSLVIDESGHWDYSVYSIKTQFLVMGERKIETFFLRSIDGNRFAVTIVLVGAHGGASIEELETTISFG
ncbi:VCBS domain-containing protein [Vibrio europaeus]|uniref:Adhesin n=1 Tax=Vibrio europaeus TaxID=300876 RepID=A0A178J7A3_9VIBR|nr:VCBS domain-containing protein [Vibrio europaeus]MDC5705750.1 VCBS domain-containing protein [Vibrio europaeus]MDC5711029.1 VCBS domain-containing protein [Vibrio europaeus]MDC5716119.1 VCBS domain-containing protein [Vibrio europaeus]MDC5720279.1 VCBS domain-containing protein [Vibrio europaeus]MDC5723834.1 VCBS domain-containing protein [Vibrio europaeus]